MSAWYFYSQNDGLFAPGSMRLANAADVAANTPPNHVALYGDIDPHASRVDLQTLQVVAWQPAAPASTNLQTWVWSPEARRWLSKPTIQALRLSASADIDRTAGEIRLRYITDVPGQQAVYLRKLDEATAYLTAYAINPLAIAPPHIAAEATATGAPPLAVAQEVASLGALWTEGLSPAIEAARIGGKRAVSLATGQTDDAIAAAIEAARVAAIAALEAI